MIDVLINLMGKILSQCICIANLYISYNFVCQFYFNKAEKNMEKCFQNKCKTKRLFLKLAMIEGQHRRKIKGINYTRDKEQTDLV